jgi:tetratricopeptide (TPR) repeat protein
VLGSRWEQARETQAKLVAGGLAGTEAGFWNARILVGEGQLDEAAKVCAELVSRNDATPEMFAHAANTAIRTGQRELASDYAKRALKGDTNNRDAIVILAQLDIAAGRADQARASLSELVATQPNDNIAIRVLAALLHRDGDHEGALAMHKAVVENNPADENAILGLSEVLAQLGRFDELDAFAQNMVASTRPLEGARSYAAGLAQLGTGQSEAAVESLTKTIALLPDYAGAWLALGQAGMQSGQPTRAIEALDQALRKRPDLLAATLLKARIQLQSANLQGARATLRGLDNLSSPPPDLHILRAQLALLERRAPDALALLLQIVERSPGRSDARIASARLLTRLQRLDEASAIIEASGDPNNAGSLAALGVITQRRGETEEAKRLLAVCRTWPSFYGRNWVARGIGRMARSGRV